MLTLPGLAVSISSRQARKKAALALGREEGLWDGIASLQRHRRVSRELPVEQIGYQRGGQVQVRHRLQTAPCCHAVDFENERMIFPVTIAVARCMWRRNQVDACIVETQCAGRSHGNIGED